MRRAFALTLLLVAAAMAAAAQQLPPGAPEQAAGDTLASGADRVEVAQTAPDRAIGERLRDILGATGRFSALRVQVKKGVVFLDGVTSTEDDRRWAGDLARNTEGVAAVLNRISVTRPSILDFDPAVEGMRDFARGAVFALPVLLTALLILLAALAIAIVGTRVSRRIAGTRTQSSLLRDVIARGIGLVIMLGGVFVALRVAGLTTIALTVVGGTGVLGIVLGIAFRDISENLLSSVFLSVQRPFRSGDLIEIEGVVGYVQRLTIRATVLMSLTGNHVQIPNSTVYKSIIRNYTSNPNRREDFLIGIGFDDKITDAQKVALEVMSQHPAVLKDPEPWVLVDSLGDGTVKLRVYFWLDGSTHSWLKVRSSVIRLVKRAFQERGISIPDEAREVIFPRGVPVVLQNADSEAAAATPSEDVKGPRAESRDVATESEAGLRSDAGEIEQQARGARVPEEGEDLLGDGEGAAPR